MIGWHSGAGTRLWRCPAGPQSSCMRAGHCRCQGLAGLSGWRLHKYRLADLRGPDTRTTSCTARPKHGVRLSWGRSETSKKIKHTRSAIIHGVRCKEQTEGEKKWPLVPLDRPSFSDAIHQTPNNQDQEHHWTDGEWHSEHQQTCFCTQTHTERLVVAEDECATSLPQETITVL